jgi:fatty-acyl-CoA synthase
MQVSQALAHDWVAYNARMDPAAFALSSPDTGESRTWAELEDRVAAVAAVLVDGFGVQAGDRVAMICENDVRVFEVQFSCMRIGAIMVPLNWRLALPELALMVRDTEPRLLFHDEAWRHVAEQLAAPGQATALTRVIWHPASSGEPDLESLIAGARRIPATQDMPMSATTHILYTSGTTGVPKGALSTNATMVWQALNVAQLTDVVRPGARILVQQPLFHAGGLHTLANPALYFGNGVVVTRRFDARQCLALMTDPEHGITHMVGVETMFDMMSQLPEFDNADLSGMRHVHMAGSTPVPSFFQRWAEKGLIIQQFYGGTEMGPAIAGLPRSMALRKLGTCGLPVRHSQVRLVDPVTRRDVAAGEVGEVWVRGPSVTPGYWRREEQHEEFFTDGYFMTGDAARMDEEGYLSIVGRFKDMYKSGGENIYAAEVEMVLARTPNVAEVAVIGVPDEKWVETGMAVVVPRPGTSVSLEDLHAQCGGVLARYKFPKHLVVLDSMPRNATGKVIKSELRQRYAQPAQQRSPVS